MGSGDATVVRDQKTTSMKALGFTLSVITASVVTSSSFGEPLRVGQMMARHPPALSVSDWAAIRQQAYVKASNPGVGDEFARAVAISGNTVVVGSDYEDSNATGVNGDQTNNEAQNSGAAYVFVRDGTNWIQEAYLKASNASANDLFGFEVAVSGDTLVVSAFAEAAGAGAAYIFVRNGKNWTQQAYLKGSNTRAGDAFYKVTVSGDTVVVGAPREDSGATGVNGNQQDFTAADSGAAYVFVRDGTNWSQQAYLKASNAGIDDRFGFVALSGDTLLVGASREDSDAVGVNGDQNNDRASDSGAAYIFVRGGTNWSQQAYLKASNTSAADRFGWAMSLSGDTAVVGAHWEDSNATGVNGDQTNNAAVDSGAAYVFVRSGTNWAQQAYLKASNTEPADNFGGGPVTPSATYPGTTVAVSGDTVVVGAIWEDSNATGVNGDQANNEVQNSGAIYIFAASARPELQVPSQYGSIQDAVNAAVPGDTIRIAAGDYFEQVTVTNITGLTLAGESGAVLHATNTMIQTLLPHGAELVSVSLLGIVNSEVNITGLTFDGENLGEMYATFDGINYIGSSGRVENCVVRRFRRSTLRVTTFTIRGINVWNGVSLGTPPISVGVFNSTFEENETSVVLAGDDEFNPTTLRTSFILEGNTVVGFGPVTPPFDGILILTGAGGEVKRNIIRDYVYLGSATRTFSGGIAATDRRNQDRGYIPVRPVRYDGNTFSNNNLHLFILGANESQVMNNIFQPTASGVTEVALVVSGTNIVVANNDFHDMPLGVVLVGGDTFPRPPAATNPKLIDNWFCNVTEPIRIDTLVSGLEQLGTETACPSRPALRIAGTSLTVRTWHGAPVVLEQSSDLQSWSTVHTNTMTLPSFVYDIAAGEPRRFYRARQP